MPTFPSLPSTNDEYTENDITYVYTGSKWKQVVRPISAKGIKVIPTANTATIDLSLGNFFEISYDTNITIDFTNIPDIDTNQHFSILLNAASTDGFSLANASYDNKSSVIIAATPTGVSFKPDGSLMFVTNNGGQAIISYSLTSNWDVSTATFVMSFSVSGQDTSPWGIFFKPDGTQMYMVGITNDRVYQYGIIEPWDLSTAFYQSAFISVAAQETVPMGLSFKPDGTKMYISGSNSDAIFQYDLSTPWQIATAVYENKFILLASQDLTIRGHTFNDTGNKLFVVGDTNDRIFQYNLTIPWDLSSGSYSGISFLVSSQETAPIGIHFKPDGDKMYIIGSASDVVHQYSTTSEIKTVTWPSTIEWQDSTAPVITPGKSCLIEFTTANEGPIRFFARSPERDIE
jgi:DNA-binding beta-propeller fold protein YncE